MIKLGSKNVAGIRIGGTPVKAVYQGADLIWPVNNSITLVYSFPTTSSQTLANSVSGFTNMTVDGVSMSPSTTMALSAGDHTIVWTPKEALVPIEAFYNIRTITSVSLGSGIVAVEDNAFNYCDGITALTFGCLDVQIGKRAFYQTNNLPLANTNLSALTTSAYLGQGCFYSSSPNGNGETLDISARIGNVAFNNRKFSNLTVRGVLEYGAFSNNEIDNLYYHGTGNDSPAFMNLGSVHMFTSFDGDNFCVFPQSVIFYSGCTSLGYHFTADAPCSLIMDSLTYPWVVGFLGGEGYTSFGDNYCGSGTISVPLGWTYGNPYANSVEAVKDYSVVVRT